MTRVISLLAHPSPALRYLVLRYLFPLPAAPDPGKHSGESRGPASESFEADPSEIAELAETRLSDPYVTDLCTMQRDDGSFAALPQGSTLSPLLTTGFALSVYGFLGFDSSFDSAARAADYVIACQAPDGSWPLGGQEGSAEGYDMVPLQTAIPLRGLCSVGLHREPAVERGAGWLIEQRLEDGAWPTGMAKGSLGYVAGYRRLPHSRWGCRSNTTGCVAALSLHPDLATGDEARKGLDHLLARESHDDALMGYEVGRLSGYLQARGFITHFAQFDGAFLLALAARCGASREDSRVGALLDRIDGEAPLIRCRANAAASPWLTYYIERAKRSLTGRWIGREIHTPYRSYIRDPKRF